MTLRLALGNVRRCARDYAIYFITIALGVALFYAFNAISDQAVLYDAFNADSMRMIALLDAFMGVFSIAVACVLGFLVVYANRFLLRRRRREFGMYLLLGMRPARVNRILVCETLLVGLGSLVVGLIAGIALSQALAFATAGLLATTMVGYQFIVSGKAILFTALCFAIIFLVSAAIDVVYIRRSKLSNLLSPRQSSENIKLLKPSVSAAVFALAVITLGVAYWQFAENKLMGLDIHFILATVFCLIGTILFFWSVSGFVVALLQRSKHAYLKGLTAFTTKQVTSKMATAFASMSIVSFILFLALTTTCVGFGMIDLFAGNIKETTQYDVTIFAQPSLMSSEEYASDLPDFQAHDGNMAARLSENNPDWSELIKSTAQLDYYPISAKYDTILNQIPGVHSMQSESTIESIANTPIRVLSVSQYNANCALVGKPGITLAPDECAVNNLPEGFEALAQAFVDNAASFDANGTTLHFVGAIQHQAMRTSAVIDTQLEIIVPDAVTATLKESGILPSSSILNAMYTCDRSEGDKRLTHILAIACPIENAAMIITDYNNEQYAFNAWPMFQSYTGLEMMSQAGGLRMCVTYLALYIGFVLMMATAAILAIQQLSECSDSLTRYRTISIIGAREQAVLGSLRTQTCLYFLAPLGLAICHSICAVSVINGAIFAELGTDIAASVLLASAILLATYGIYLAIAYLTSRQMAKPALA